MFHLEQEKNLHLLEVQCIDKTLMPLYLLCVEGILAIFQLLYTADRNKICLYCEEEAWQT